MLKEQLFLQFNDLSSVLLCKGETLCFIFTPRSHQTGLLTYSSNTTAATQVAARHGTLSAQQTCPHHKPCKSPPRVGGCLTVTTEFAASEVAQDKRPPPHPPPKVTPLMLCKRKVSVPWAGGGYACMQDLSGRGRGNTVPHCSLHVFNFHGGKRK